ncbi:MAG: hypothetical protein ACKO04_07190 [Actinomycetes bacterium]
MIPDLDAAATPSTRKEAAALLGTWASTIAATAGVLLLTLEDLRPPPLRRGPVAWNRWVGRQDPEDVVAALVAPAALALLAVLLVVVLVTAVGVALATRRGRAVRCSSRWPSAVSGFVAAVVLLSGGPGAGASTGSGARAGGEVSARPVVGLVDASVRATTSTTTPPPPPTPAPARPPAAVVVVRPGDNLWRIAEQQVQSRPELGPTGHYWVRLIDTNRSRFVEPGNPHLILPRQELELPGQ